MKILFLAPRLPFPPDTGAKIRTFNLLKNISTQNKVTLLSFYFEEDKKSVDAIKTLGIEVILVKGKDKINLRSILSRNPVSIEKYRSDEMRDKLKELVRGGDFDLVHFDHLHMGQYRDCVNGLPCVLDEHNVESVILNRCADTQKNRLRKWLFKSQGRKMAIFESRLARRFCRCLTVSETDKKNLAELSGDGTNIEVVPNGVDTEYFSSQYPILNTQYEDALVFTGSMDWLPNNDAVIYFCQEILPLVWAKDKTIKFYVVGRTPSDELLRLSGQDTRIVVTGAVSDVRQYIARTKVFVAPLRIGGGTRLKILEAMSMGKTVVSTTVGAEGINYTKGKDIVIKDSPEEFAKALLNLLEDTSMRDSLGRAGRDLVCNNYDWRIIREKLNAVYQEVVNEGK